MTDIRITFTNGSMAFVWDDALAPLMMEGSFDVRRVSHVEPTPDGRWTAEMIDGPVLGPFALRQDALAAEREWLRQNRGL